METKCHQQTSQAAGWVTDKLPGTARALSPKAPCQREKPLRQQTHCLLSRSESSSSHVQRPIWETSSCGNPQNPLLSSGLTPKLCSVSYRSNTRLFRTIRYSEWPNSYVKRSTWTASSFYRMVPRSALPPHSVVRRRTSSLVTPSNDASSAT